MKKSILILSASALISAAFFTSCTNSGEKVENAQNNVEKANLELNLATEEYMADIEKFRTETAATIEANEKSIAEFNARIENEKIEAQAEYKSKIAELEQKNSDIKKKMAEYKAEGKEKWELFKTEFSRDMESLGKAFKDLTIKNN